MPGGSLVSKPTWWNTFRCSATSAFFVGVAGENIVLTSWLFERFHCFCWGHRALTSCATYGAGLPDGRIRELRYCLACDSPVWVEHQPDAMKPDLTWAWLEQ